MPKSSVLKLWNRSVIEFPHLIISLLALDSIGISPSSHCSVLDGWTSELFRLHVKSIPCPRRSAMPSDVVLRETSKDCRLAAARTGKKIKSVKTFWEGSRQKFTLFGFLRYWIWQQRTHKTCNDKVCTNFFEATTPGWWLLWPSCSY